VWIKWPTQFLAIYFYYFYRFIVKLRVSTTNKVYDDGGVPQRRRLGKRKQNTCSNRRLPANSLKFLKRGSFQVLCNLQDKCSLELAIFLHWLSHSSALKGKCAHADALTPDALTQKCTCPVRLCPGRCCLHLEHTIRYAVINVRWKADE